MFPPITSPTTPRLRLLASLGQVSRLPGEPSRPGSSQVSGLPSEPSPGTSAKIIAVPLSAVTYITNN